MEKATSFIPELPEAHPLKAKIQQLGVPLWQLARMLPFSESWWSRALNGIRPLPEEMAEKLDDVLAALAAMEGKKCC